MSVIDLSSLPPPQVIEELNYETYRERTIVQFVKIWDDIRLANPTANLPPYNVAMLETDPVVILNESESFRETILRGRINAALRATLLAFARGNDLEHLAAFYDVVRMAGEDDDRLVARTVLAIQGRSTGGTEPRYRFIAMSADVRVRDAIVYTVGRSPLIHVAVFSTDANGVASPALLAKVNAALQDSAVRMVNDTIEVSSAVQSVINLTADVWLLPDADSETLARAEANLRAAWAVARALGRDLTTSWWTAQLFIPGVQKVVALAPATDVIVAPSESVSIGQITLNNKGRAY